MAGLKKIGFLLFWKTHENLRNFFLGVNEIENIADLSTSRIINRKRGRRSFSFADIELVHFYLISI